MLEVNLTLHEMADLLGVSTKTVGQLAREGLLRKSGRGKYATASIPVYLEHLRQLAGQAGRPAGPATLDAERTRLAKAQADERELKAAALRGELVDARAVEREWSDILRRVRAAVFAVPSRVRQRLSHLSAGDAGVIDAELRDLLAEVADDGGHVVSGAGYRAGDLEAAPATAPQ